MRLSLLLAFAIIAGCGGYDPVEDNHGYGYGHDVLGTTGMKLRYMPTLVAADVTLYEAQFQEVQACAGIAAPAPFVIIVPASELNGSGYYHSAPPLILIEPSGLAFKHEAVHYLLDYSTGNLDQTHASVLFQTCAPAIIGQHFL